MQQFIVNGKVKNVNVKVNVVNDIYIYNCCIRFHVNASTVNIIDIYIYTNVSIRNTKCKNRLCTWKWKVNGNGKEIFTKMNLYNIKAKLLVPFIFLSKCRDATTKLSFNLCKGAYSAVNFTGSYNSRHFTNFRL